MTATDIDALIEKLESWAALVASGYEVPAASTTMHEAATALRTAQAERDAENAYASKCQNELADMTNAWRESQADNERMREALNKARAFIEAEAEQRGVEDANYDISAKKTLRVVDKVLRPCLTSTAPAAER